MEYKILKAEDYCDSVRDGTHDSPKKVEKGFKLITSKHIRENSIDFESAYCISEEDYIKVNQRSLVEKNDILYSMIGTIGLIYRVNEKPNFAIKNMGLFKVNDELKSKWLFYYLKSPDMIRYIKTLLTGSTQQYVTLKNLRELPIKFPKQKEDMQKVIKILENIDRKIELNNQINDNLHKLANELFNSWFVDFNYPNSNGKMKNSSLGLIPEDWHISQLSEIAECQNGYAFYKDGYDENGVMVIDLGNINLNGTFIYTNADKFITEERIQTDKFNKYKVYKNDLIMVMTDRKATMELLGKTGKVYENKEFLLNQRMYRIRSKINTNYLYTALNSNIVLNKLKSKALGSVQKYVNTGHINELELIIGTDEIMEKFSNIVDPIYSEIENITVENTNLEKLKDTLLPKLMNGEIDLDKIEI